MAPESTLPRCLFDATNIQVLDTAAPLGVDLVSPPPQLVASGSRSHAVFLIPSPTWKSWTRPRLLVHMQSHHLRLRWHQDPHSRVVFLPPPTWKTWTSAPLGAGCVSPPSLAMASTSRLPRCPGDALDMEVLDTATMIVLTAFAIFCISIIPYKGALQRIICCTKIASMPYGCEGLCTVRLDGRG